MTLNTLIHNHTNSNIDACVLINLLFFTGNKLLAFESTDTIQLAKVNIEEYDEDSEDRVPKSIWCQENTPYMINDVAGSCAVVDSPPPLVTEISDYVKRRLNDYVECYAQ